MEEVGIPGNIRGKQVSGDLKAIPPIILSQKKYNSKWWNSLRTTKGPIWSRWRSFKNTFRF
jgi:hypothetical protein